MSDRTPAQIRWSMAVTKKDRIGAAFQRAEEAAAELERAADHIATLNESVYRINQRLDGLESAAKAGQDSKAKCANCGHHRFVHDGNGCNDRVPGSFGFYICPCKSFLPIANPTPDPVDKVLCLIAAAYREFCEESGGHLLPGMRSLRDAYRARSGEEHFSDKEIHEAILAYGLNP